MAQTKIGGAEKFMLAISILGLLVSAYLTVQHYTNKPVACPSVGIINCESVLNSPYSYVLGVPVCVLGVLFFIAEFALIFLGNRDMLVLFNGLGIGFVVYFIYSEYLIGSICIYCTSVHVITVLLFITSVYMYRSTSAKAAAVT